jgi:hypothetical protein
MPRILDTRNGLDKTIRIFDSFYAVNLTVNGDEYDVVHGYFLSVCTTKTIADNFTAVFFRISQDTGISALDLLAQIKGTDKMTMNQVLAYYLNSFKSKTTLYGISIIPKPNQLVQRNIVQ